MHEALMALAFFLVPVASPVAATSIPSISPGVRTREPEPEADGAVRWVISRVVVVLVDLSL